MHSDSLVLELIDLIYSAAGDAERWTIVLERVARVLKANIATIHHQHLTSKETSFAAALNIDPVALETYTAHYAPLNVWFTTYPRLLKEGQIYTGEMLCPDQILIRSEFYNDWLKPNEMRNALGSVFFKSGSATSSLSLFRPITAGAFGDEEAHLMKTLMPHLQRAFQLHNRIQGLERKGAAAGEALNRLQRAVVLMDAQGTVLLVNQAAAALFAAEKTLRLTSRGLVAANASENRKLNELIDGATKTGIGNSLHPGGAMLVSRGSFRDPLQVLVMPLRTRTLQLGKASPVVAIFISDPERAEVSEPRVFRQLYGLTAAEARLAQILCCGDSLKAASEQLGVTVDTVRSQLKAIFGKTNTNRQSQLVRLFLLAPTRAGGQRKCDK